MPSRQQRLSQFVYDFARADDLKQFRACVTDGIGTVVECDLASYTEVDLRAQRSFAITDRPLAELPQIVADLGRLAHEHPLIVRSRGDAAAISDFLTLRQFHALELYHEVYRSLGAEDQIAIHLQTNPDAVVVGLALNRAVRGFTTRERETLDMLRPLLTDGYYRAVARERGRARLRELSDGRVGHDAAVIALDRYGTLAFASERAQLWLGSASVPRSLCEWATAQVLAGEESTRVWLRGRQFDVTLSARDHAADPLLLELKPAGREGPAAALTHREREILELVANGASDKQLADRLGISRRTVANHLQSVYRKLDVENRTAASAMLKRDPAG